MRRVFSIKGMGLIEVLISVAIVAVVALVLAQFLTQSQTTSKNIQGSTQCNQAVQSATAGFSSRGIRLEVMPPSVPSTSPGDPISYPDPLANFPLQEIVGSGTTPPLHTSQLIVGAVSLLEIMYNNNPSFCESEDGVEVSDLINAPNLVNPRTLVKIFPVDGDGSVDTSCPQPFLARPLPSGSAGVVVYPNLIGSPGAGFNLSIEIQHGENGDKLCSSGQSYFHQVDNQAPTLSFSASNPNGMGSIRNGLGESLNSGNIFTSCGLDNDNNGYRNIFADFVVQLSEGGSTFLCKEAAVSEFQPCHELMLGSRRVTAFNASSTLDPAQGVYDVNLSFYFEDLEPDKIYEIQVKAIDSGGNESNVVNLQQFIVDGSRPTIANIDQRQIGPGQFRIGTPEDGLFGRNELPPGYANTVNWNLAQVQCDNQPVSFQGIYEGYPADNWQACTSCQGLTCTGVAACVGTTNFNITHGTHTVTMTARDVCGDGATASYSWTAIIEFNPTSVGNIPAFDDNNSKPGTDTDFYPVTVTPPSRDPAHYVVQCDCNNFNNADLVDGDNICHARNNQANSGCYNPPGKTANFFYHIYDICGRTDTNLEGLYAVRGDANDPCKQQMCGTNANPEGEDDLVCCVQTPDGICTPGRCVDTTPLIGSSCTGGIVGSPPASNCPDSGLFQCNYTSECLYARMMNGTPRYCTAGQSQGDACSFRARGECSGSSCRYPSCPGSADCDGTPIAPGNICGDAGVSDGDTCYFMSDSTCGPVTGNCSLRGSGPSFGITNNPICPDRGPFCDLSAPPPPPPPACPGPNEYDTLGQCNAAVDLETTTCGPCGSCFCPNECSSGYVNIAICQSKVTDQSRQMCVPTSDTPACYEVQTCSGSEWATYSACMDPAQGNCQGSGDCSAPPLSCFSCASTTTTTSTTSSSTTTTVLASTTTTTNSACPPSYPYQNYGSANTACQPRTVESRNFSGQICYRCGPTTTTTVSSTTTSTSECLQKQDNEVFTFKPPFALCSIDSFGNCDCYSACEDRTNGQQSANNQCCSGSATLIDDQCERGGLNKCNDIWLVTYRCDPSGG